MNLTLELLGSNQGWETVLQQMGVCYNIVDYDDITVDGYKPICLIAHNFSNISDPDVISDLVKAGGTVLFESQVYARIFNRKVRKKKIKSIFPQTGSIFESLGVIDLHSVILIDCKRKRDFWDKKLSIFSDIVGKGTITVIPFNLYSLMKDARSCRKRFPAGRNELPSEIVSKVSKGKIRKMIEILIKKILSQNDLPLVQKWFSNCESLFSFRIDTDYCTAVQAKELYNVCRKKEITGTWFVDTGSKDLLTETYAKMNDQEIAFHCDRHRIFPDKKNNEHYISIGLSKLADTHINVNGYAAPFGEWNNNLAEVLDEKGFNYSSEFALNYDDLPFYPYTDKKVHDVLQIPVHPISLGRLRRSHFSEEEMVQYYKDLIDRKITEMEPILIYHHPAHEHFNVFEEIFEYVNDLGLQKFSFQQWAVLWKYLQSIDLQVSISENKLKLSADNGMDFYIKISYKGKYTILPFRKKIDLNKVDWQVEKIPEKLREKRNIRKKHWRDLLYNYESYRGKLKR